MENKEIKYVELGASCVITPDALLGTFIDNMQAPAEDDNRIVTLKEWEEMQ